MERVKKENKEKIMEMIKKAGSEEYETSWNKAGVFSTSKKKSEIKKGKNSRACGARFELKVRKDLESKGRVVDKWNNNVDLSSKDYSPRDDSGKPSGEPDEGKLIIAKKKFNPFSKVMTIGTGFPDFISIKQIHKGAYSVIGVEVKMNGILSKTEKQKCAWYLKNKVFSEIWIAKKGTPKGVPSSTKKKDTLKGTSKKTKESLSEEGKKRGQIEYVDFKEKYGEKFNQLN